MKITEELINEVLNQVRPVAVNNNQDGAEILFSATSLKNYSELLVARLLGDARQVVSTVDTSTSKLSAAEVVVNTFLIEVEAELKRARAKFPGDTITTIALGEEVGELSKALLDEPGANVWKEAVQTATMAARVAIDGDNSVDAWRLRKGLDNHRKHGSL